MKIGIITYHKVYNCGSSLQAYATLQTFKKLGVDAELINFVPDRFKNYGSFKQTYADKRYFGNPLKAFVATLFSLYSRKYQKTSFDKFNKYLELGKELYTDDLPKQKSYDAYFTGSDQVWNNHFGGFEKAYFLDFVPKGKPCFAYSASFGKSEFTSQENEELKKLLTKYKYLSIREDSGCKPVKQLGFEAEQLLDPIYTLTKEEWQAIVHQSVKGKYILIYQISYKSNCIGYAKELSRLKGGLPIYFIEYERKPHHSGVNYVFTPEVNDFLELINGAEYVVTDSFHGTSFSLKFNTKFFAILPPAFPSRLTSILNLLNLTNRVISNKEDLVKVCDAPIDWNYVNEKLGKEAEKNIQFLSKCLASLKLILR